jgi:hypothetical protein
MKNRTKKIVYPLIALFVLGSMLILFSTGTILGPDRRWHTSEKVVAQDNWILVEGGAWIANAKIVNDLRQKAIQYIITESEIQGVPIIDLSKYSFQYQGRQKNNKFYIFVNAFCESPSGWPMEKEMYRILDGGRCYFQFKYDNRLKKFHSLIINGEA